MATREPNHHDEHEPPPSAGVGPSRLDTEGHGWSHIDEYDSVAEVDATFRTQRRIALGYFVVFLALTLGVPTLTLVLEWWSGGRVIGDMSPGFLMAAGGLYLCFFGLSLAAATLSTAVEDRMLGGPGAHRERRRRGRWR